MGRKFFTNRAETIADMMPKLPESGNYYICLREMEDGNFVRVGSRTFIEESLIVCYMVGNGFGLVKESQQLDCFVLQTWYKPGPGRYVQIGNNVYSTN